MSWHPPLRRCKQGNPIKTMAKLLRVLKAEPSVWFGPKRGPIPCAIVVSWQLQYVLGQLSACNLFMVNRPRKPRQQAVLP